MKLGRERVRRAELVLRLLRERAPELVEGRGDDHPADLRNPVAVRPSSVARRPTQFSTRAREDLHGVPPPARAPAI